MRILVVNAGSSSLKLSVLDPDNRLVARESWPAPSGQIDEAALLNAIESFAPIDAVGHRVVHGGSLFTEAVLVDEAVRQRLVELVDLAPLHQPKSLQALEAVSRLLPGVPAVACFDTAFHSTMPAVTTTYALPQEWRQRWDLRRFGFHGLSHAYASRRGAELLGRDLCSMRIVTCHLGAGASLAAVRHGTSVDTTMGFTPLEGLVMATRSGSIDPGLVLWLEEHAGISPSELAFALENRSGLLGLGGTADMKGLLEAEAEGDPSAALAVGVYLHRLRGAIASMAAAMDGLDALVFTGGVGESSAEIRERIAQGLGFLGIALDPSTNWFGPPDREIADPNSKTRCVVVEAREDLEIARSVRSVLALGT